MKAKRVLDFHAHVEFYLIRNSQQVNGHDYLASTLRNLPRT